jgi:hypothetical protein
MAWKHNRYAFECYEDILPRSGKCSKVKDVDKVILLFFSSKFQKYIVLLLLSFPFHFCLLSYIFCNVH